MATTTTDEARRTADEVLDNAEALVPALRSRFHETEKLRRLPDATISDVSDAGIFSLLLPASLGGSAAGIPELVRLLRTLAHGDPTVAWTVGFLTTHNWFLARFPEESQAEFFSDGKPAQLAGVANPPGRAEAIDGGYLVTGHWGYSSAVLHSEWVMVAGVVEGEPAPRWFVIPRDEIEVEDTWYVSGMKGTGSNHVRLDGRFVPTIRSIPIPDFTGRNNPGALVHGETIYSYDVRDVTSFLVPTITLGAADAMLEDFRGRLETRRDIFQGKVIGDTAPALLRFARALSDVRAAGALIERAVQLTVDANASGGELSDELRAELKLDFLSVMRLSWDAIQTAIQGSGSGVFRETEFAQHLVRDAQVMLGHLTVDADWMMLKSAEILLGRATDAKPTARFV